MAGGSSLSIIPMPIPLLVDRASNTLAVLAVQMITVATGVLVAAIPMGLMLSVMLTLRKFPSSIAIGLNICYHTK